ncbi:DUF4190 domain-containing protein [Planctomonas psychrotolerans]|uniref:DUF4190 domain-containing protein n=1 Tax=Planctomonas psychrotolerans TaxID=2528712 RepID=UPI001238C0DB|nr:DUF4190 domain-containing protein [Planctomonas psychrotolerans]
MTYPADQYPAPRGELPYAGYPPVRPTNVLAIIALVVAFFLPPAAIVCGHLALGQIRRTGEAGNGLAMAGLVLGYVFTGVILLLLVAAIAVPLFLFSLLGATTGSY